jgi:hypothetical protein
MPATPKRTLIVQAVQTRLVAITAGATYNFTLGATKVLVWRDLKSQPWTVGELPALTIRDGIEQVRQALSGIHLHELPLDIMGAVTSSTLPEDEARKLLADIVTAIGVDRKWSGLAFDTDPIAEGIEVAQEGEHIAGARVQIVIKYRTNSFNPYA